MLVGGLLIKEGTIDVVGPHGGEGAYVAGHAAHKASNQRGDAEPEQAGSAVADQHQRQHFVIAVLSCSRGYALGYKMHHAAVRIFEHGQREQAGQDNDQRHHHLEGRADDGRHLAARRFFALRTRCTTRKSVVQ